MIIKIHKTEGNKMLLTVCDSELIDKKFEEGEKQLDLTSDFYKGDERSDQEVCDLMRNAYIINLVGEKAVALALKEELIDEAHIKKIDNISYAQISSQEV